MLTAAAAVVAADAAFGAGKYIAKDYIRPAINYATSYTWNMAKYLSTEYIIPAAEFAAMYSYDIGSEFFKVINAAYSEENSPGQAATGNVANVPISPIIINGLNQDLAEDSLSSLTPRSSLSEVSTEGSNQEHFSEHSPS